MQSSDSPNLKTYVKAFIEFEKYIKYINKDLGEKFEHHKGFLINKDEIDEIKNKIKFQTYKDIYKDYPLNSSDRIQKKDYTIEEIEFRNSDYLLNMLFNKNKYILINRDLWKLLCKEGKENTEPIIYEINYNNIKFKLDDFKELKFSNKFNENLISIEEFYSYYNIEYYSFFKSNYESIVNNTYNKIKEFYDFEENFKRKLKHPIKTNYNKGYLVDINWFHNWEKFNDYLNIKSNYFEKTNQKKEIINHIIYIQELNKKNGISLDEPKVNEYNYKTELEEYLKRNTLVILDYSTLSLWPNLKEKGIFYYLYDNKIEFYFESKDSLVLETKDYIISKKSENNIENPHLLQLAKIFYFRRFLNSELFNGHKMKSNNNSIFLIKKDIINQYLAYFNYEILSSLLNKMNIDYKNLENKFQVIINYVKKYNNNYYEQIKLKEKNHLALNFSGQEFYLEQQNFQFEGKTHFYITDFEIIDNDIFSFFKEKQIVQDKQVIKGKYIAEDNKIFLNYNYNNENFYQIGSLDINNENFVLELILEESMKNKMFEFFNNLGITTLINNKKNNIISSGLHIIGYYYEFQVTDNRKDEDINMEEKQYNIIEIASTLIMLNKYEQNLKTKLELSKTQINDLRSNSNPFATTPCKLVNEDFLNQIKELYDYQQFTIILKNYQSFLNSEISEEIVNYILNKEKSYKALLLGKESEFVELKKIANEFFKIEKKLYEQGMDKFKYPLKFNVIDEKLFEALLNILDLKILNNKTEPEEILLTYNYGNITFRGMKEQFCDNYMSLLYIYSCKNNPETDAVSYLPEAILDFKNSKNIINQFPIIMKENILNKINKNGNYFFKNFSCSVCLNFVQNAQEDTNQISDSYLYDDDKNKYFNKLLNFSFLFYLKYRNFYQSVQKFQNQKEEKIIYLINKNYIDEIKSISYFYEIKDTLKNHKEIEEDFIKGLNYLMKLKLFLDKDVLIKFFCSKRDIINQKFENPNLIDRTPKYFNNDHKNGLFYFENFQIVDKEILDLLKKFDQNINQGYIVAKAIFSSNKVILLININKKFTINIGKINDADVFLLEYLIQVEYTSFYESDSQLIFNEILKYGYNYFYSKYLKGNKQKIQMFIGNNLVYAKIYQLHMEESQNNFENEIKQNNSSIVSRKLKGMILLSINQINIDKFREYSRQKIEKVYLMNPNYLLAYKYDEIFSLLKENNEILKSCEQMCIPSNPIDSNSLDEIIEKLNKDKLSKIDDELQKIDLSNKNWEAKIDYIKLKDKTISICKEFILINNDIFTEIKDYLSLYSAQKFFYYSYENGDIIASNSHTQHVIFFGYINQESQLFNLKYILDLESGSSMTEELKNIQNYGIENYMKERTIFSAENNKDLISPIFGENNEPGNFYKYNPGFNYQDTKGEDYTKYLYRGNFPKIMKLYNYYNEFKRKSEKSYNEYGKSYYLINKEVMNSIKKEYNYEIIIETLNKAKFQTNNNKKKMLYILKNLPEGIYEDFIKDPKPIEKRYKTFASPIQITFTIPEPPNDSINIYKNFEILDSTTAKEFINDIFDQEYYNRSDDNYIECSFREGNIILHYPIYKLKNDKYVYEIGKIKEDKTFIPEYLIIYMKDNCHFNKIKYNLNKYLQSIEIENQFVNGIFPITQDESYWSDFEELGKIIDLKKIKGQNIFETDTFQGGTMDNGNGNQGYDGFSNQDIEQKKKKKSKTSVSLNKYTIKEYNLDEKTMNRDIKTNYSMPPLIGLDNIGATCYMNATLQCLCNIPNFINYFKYNNHLKEKVRNDLECGNNMLCSSFKLLIEKLWPDKLYYNNNPNFNYTPFGGIGSNNTYSNKKNESYPPNEFKRKISGMNPLFQGVAANDAKDLVNFLIMTLHDELNTAEKKNLNTSAINQDQRNQQLMFNLFTQDFVNNNKSIISDLFYGVNYNIVQCNGCGERSFNYQTYFFFVFPLEEVRIFKSQNNYNNNFNYNMNFNNNEVNIYDCFLYDQRINYMMGENAMYCNYCKRQCNSQMCTLLAFGPEIIIIILNRGQGAQFKVKVNFQEQLNLYSFIDYKDTGVNYQLIGVITHLGGNDMSGHFIAYCKNPISNSWYQYNDSIVNEVNQANFKAEVIDYAMPYLLFYQKVGK